MARNTAKLDQPDPAQHRPNRQGPPAHRGLKPRRGRRYGWALLAGLIVALTATTVSLAVLWPTGSPASPTALPALPTASVIVTCQDRSSDAAVLQRAINSSPEGAAIEFRGTCLLTTGLTLPGDRTYMGQSTTGTVLTQDGSASYVLASSDYVHNSTTTGPPLSIFDLTVTCDGSGSTDGIILLNWQTDVENVDVNGCGGSGIVDTNTNASGGAITNTSVNSRFDNNFITGSGQYGFYVQDSGNSVTDGFLENNDIASSRLDAIHLDNAAGWDISGNHLYSDGQNGISANRLFGTTIASNYVEDFGDGKRSGTWYGIVATAQDGSGSTILGNKIFNDLGESPGPTYVYIGVTQVDSGVGHLSVTGNVIRGDRRSDVGVSLSGGQNKLEVAASGNQVSGVGVVLLNAGNATVTAESS
jgi:hypothetical protein